MAVAGSAPCGRGGTPAGACRTSAYRWAAPTAAAAGSGKVKTGSRRSLPGNRTLPFGSPTATATNVFSHFAAIEWMAFRVCATSVTAISVNTVTTASTTGESATIARTSRSCSADTAAPRSIGFAVGTSIAASRPCVASSKSVTTKPASAAASAARISGPPEFPTIATRGPAGRGCVMSRRAAAGISCMGAIRITPLRRNNAAITTSEGAAAGGGGRAARRAAAGGPGLGGHPRVPRAAGSLADVGAPGLDRQHRFPGGDSTRDADEAARITDRFEVGGDHLDAVIRGPGRQHVVATDIGLVTHRNELGETHAYLVCRRRKCHAECARLGEDCEATGAPRHVPEGGVETNLRVRVRDADAVGAEQPDAKPAGGREDLLLQLRPSGARLAESATEQDRGANPSPSARLERRHHRASG